MVFKGSFTNKSPYLPFLLHFNVDYFFVIETCGKEPLHSSLLWPTKAGIRHPAVTNGNSIVIMNSAKKDSVHKHYTDHNAI